MEHTQEAQTELDQRLAERLTLLREERGWTLDQLAAASGVSKANLSRLEKGQVSPTASTLGKLCSAFGLSMSRLLALAEQGGDVVLKRDHQQIWRDPDGGFHRRAVSTSGAAFGCDVIECELEADRRIDYDAPSRPGQEHHIYCYDGVLKLEVDGVSHRLEAGDSLKYRLRGASAFEAQGRSKVRYLVVVCS